jgi:hypothetical protein
MQVTRARRGPVFESSRGWRIRRAGGGVGGRCGRVSGGGGTAARDCSVSKLSLWQGLLIGGQGAEGSKRQMRGPAAFLLANKRG